MSTTYPTSKQEFTNPTTTSKLNSPSHAGLHADLADTLEALQDQLGITGARSTVTGLKPNADSTTAITITNAAEDTTILTFDTSNDLAIFKNSALAIWDTGGDHKLKFATGSDLDADYTLTLTTGNGNRTVTLSANLTVEATSTINQDVTTDASPQFAGATLTEILNISTTNQNGIVFGSLGTAAKAIDLSGSGLSGASDYWVYNSANSFWDADSKLSITTLALDNGLSVLERSNSGQCEDTVLGPSGEFGHSIVSLSALTKDAFLMGQKTAVGSLTGCTSSGTITITKTTHGLSVAVGDLVHITDATTTADEGFYRLVSTTASTLVVDRALSGSDADVDLTVYKDGIGIFATDGTNGQRICGYSHQDKPLQIGGDVLAATGHSLGGEDVLFGGKIEIKGAAYFDYTVNFYNHTIFGDNIQFGFGDDSDAVLDWSTAQTTSNTLVWGLGDTSKSIIFCANTDKNKNFDRGAQSNPTAFVQSATNPDTDHGEYIGLSYTGLVQGTMETDRATYNLNITGSSAFASAVTNLDGGHIVITAGDGASGSAGDADGGHVYIDGGIGYGTGDHGDVILAATRGNVTCGGTFTIINSGIHILDTGGDHDLILAVGSDLDADYTLTFTTGNGNRTVTLSANLTVEATSTINQDVSTDADAVFGTLTLNNSGLHILDTGGDHDLIFAVGGDLDADYTLTFTTGNANRGVTLSGDLNVEASSNINQDVTTDASPTFAGVTLNNTGLHLLDTNASHDLIIAPGSDLDADYTLTLTTGNASRTMTLSGDPTLADWFDQSVKQAASPQFAGLDIDGSNGSSLNLKTITEEVTIAVGDGADPVVTTAGNLAPAGSLIIGVAFRVTDAPGGGATEIDIGRTNGGNLDEFIDGASCDILGETGTFYLNSDAATTGPMINAAADTLTLTTDADVTGDEMKVRIVVWYYDMTAPTS